MAFVTQPAHIHPHCAVCKLFPGVGAGDGIVLGPRVQPLALPLRPASLTLAAEAWVQEAWVQGGIPLRGTGEREGVRGAGGPLPLGRRWGGGRCNKGER